MGSSEVEDLTNRLSADLKEAMLKKDELTVTVIRMLSSAMKYYQVEVGHELSLHETLKVIQKEAKKRQEAIINFVKASRDELANRERQELGVLEQYLPAVATKEQVSAGLDIVLSNLKLVQEIDSKSMGAVMVALKDHFQDQGLGLDGAMASAMIKERLS